jgi:hypothetical protein
MPLPLRAASSRASTISPLAPIAIQTSPLARSERNRELLSM